MRPRAGPVKLAKELREGDQIVIWEQEATRQKTVTVVAVVPRVKLIERRQLIVTLRAADGTDVQRTYSEYSSVRIAS